MACVEALFRPLVVSAEAPSRVRSLAAELAAGSNEALAELYDLLADRVYGLALWLTASPEDAADVVQQTFVRVWERRRLVGGARKPESYVLRMARSVAADCLRRRPPAAELDEGLLVAVLPDPTTAVDAQRLSRLVLRLPAGQRAVLYLHCFAGLSFREVGRVLRLPTFTAASRYRLALDRLREWMGA